MAYTALVQAAQRFEPSLGHDFLSYAVPTIEGGLRRYFRDFAWTIRPPRRVQESRSQILAASAVLAGQLGRAPRARDVADYLSIDLDTVETAMIDDGCFRPTSLDAPLSDRGEAAKDVLGEPDPGIDSAEMRMMLTPAVRRLKARDRHVLRLRYYEERTQREIGEELHITQAQVSRLLSRILRDLRRLLETPVAV